MRSNSFKVSLAILCLAVGFTVVFFSPVSVVGKTKEVTIRAIERPEWVQERLKEFEDRYHSRSAWSRIFGWGEGTSSEGNSFYWIMWSNTDGYIQLYLSVLVAQEECDQVGRMVDIIGRSFECGYSYDQPLTWVGTSNDPFFYEDKVDLWMGDQLLDSWGGGGIFITHFTLFRLLDTQAFKNFEVREYLF